MFRLRFLPIIILALPVVANGHESPADCLGYLVAERLFQEKAGTPNYQEIEVALARVPVGNRDNPWEKWLDAWRRVDWATEYRDRLVAEDERQKMQSGTSVLSDKISLAFDRTMEAIRQTKAPTEGLDDWLKEHGISAEAAELFRGFVHSYRDTHNISSRHAPDLVFRVAVHERQTMCPP